MTTRDRLIAWLDWALERHGREVAMTASLAAPAHLLYESAEVASLAVDHADDDAGAEMAAHSALLSLVAAVAMRPERDKE